MTTKNFFAEFEFKKKFFKLPAKMKKVEVLKNDDPVQSLTKGIICMQLSHAFNKIIHNKCNHHSELL